MHDKWLIFDSILLSIMIFETWILFGLLHLFSTTLTEGFQDSSFLRLVRLLKTCRLARLTQLLLVLPELFVLFEGLSVAFRAVLATLGLIAVIIYVFAILF